MRAQWAARMSGPGPALPAVLILLAVLAGCTSAPGAAPAERWRPRPGADWQWQLSGRLDTSVDVPVYDIDGFDHTAATVAELHRAAARSSATSPPAPGRTSARTPDGFPRAVLGKGNGWEGERWLDIRRTDVLEPLMAARIDMCRGEGLRRGRARQHGRLPQPTPASR